MKVSNRKGGDLPGARDSRYGFWTCYESGRHKSIINPLGGYEVIRGTHCPGINPSTHAVPPKKTDQDFLWWPRVQTFCYLTAVVLKFRWCGEALKGQGYFPFTKRLGVGNGLATALATPYPMRRMLHDAAGELSYAIRADQDAAALAQLGLTKHVVRCLKRESHWNCMLEDAQARASRLVSRKVQLTYTGSSPGIFSVRPTSAGSAAIKSLVM